MRFHIPETQSQVLAGKVGLGKPRRWRPFSQQFGRSGAASISSSTRSPLLPRRICKGV